MKQALQIQLEERDRVKLEQLRELWGTSLAGAIRQLIRKYKVKESNFD